MNTNTSNNNKKLRQLLVVIAVGLAAVCGIANAFDDTLPAFQGTYVLYVDVPLGTSNQTIHLDAVLSQFENGWGNVSTRWYTLTSLPAPTDGIIYQTTSGADEGAAISTTPTNVTNSEGMIVFAPAAGAETLIQVAFDANDPSQPDARHCLLVIELYTPCVSLADLGDDMYNTVAPPIPSAVIDWDADNQEFRFNVDAPYLTDNYVTDIEFGAFNPTTSSIYDAPVCSNRPQLNSSLAQFSELWDSAPSATFPNALDGSVFPAYPSGTGDLWTQTPNNCSNVHYATEIGFAQLVSCRQRDSSYAIQVTQNSTAQSITYSGSLYVNYVRPFDPFTQTLGYTVFEHYFPFSFEFRSHIQALVGLPSEQNLRVYVRRSVLNLSDDLILDLETHYPGTGLTLPQVSPSLEIVTYSSTCADGTVDCVQTWHYSKVGWQSLDNQRYAFSWMVAAEASHQVAVNITLNQEMQELQQETGLVIGSLSLRVFHDKTQFTTGGQTLQLTKPLLPTDTIYVRGDLVVPSVDQTNFGLSVVNVWLCYSSIEGYDIEYIDGSKFGCLDPFIQDDERVQLVANGVPNNNGTAARYSVQYPILPMPSFSNPVGPSTGAAFYAMPLTAGSTRIYTVHVECVINQLTPGGKRVVRHHVITRPTDSSGETGVQSSVANVAFAPVSEKELVELDNNVNNNDNNDNYDDEHGDNSSDDDHSAALVWTLVPTAVLAVVGMICTVLIVGAIVAARRILRSKQQSDAPTEIQLEEFHSHIVDV
jgi:hypothetical protein